MAEYTRAWANKYFEVLPKEKYASNTLTVIKNTRGISVSDLNKWLGERGYVIANGYGSLKEKTFRIAHMADTTLEELKKLLDLITEYITNIETSKTI